MRKTVLVVVLLGLVGLGVFWLRLDAGRTRAGSTGEVRKDASVGAPELVDAERVVEPAASQVNAERPVRAQAAQLGEKTRAAAARALEGTIVVVDERGNEHAAEDGQFALVLGAEIFRLVRVHGGRWSMERFGNEGARPIAVERCELGGRPAVCEPAQEMVTADAPVALRARWLAELQLHVKARDTGRELEDVRLCELPIALRGSREDLELPGPELKRSERAVGASPVKLDLRMRDWLGAHVFFARSPGYAWGRVELDARKGEEQWLWLEPAGELELVVQREPLDSYARIELRKSQEKMEADYLDEKLTDTPSFVLADLPVGSYVAEARASGQLLASVETIVVAGERATATLTLALPPDGKVPFEGVLVLPAEWHASDFSLYFRPGDRWEGGGLSDGSFWIRSSDMEPVPGSKDRFHWATTARPGRYCVDWSPSLFEIELDTGPSGRRDAVIDVPPPCEVEMCGVNEAGRVVGLDSWRMWALSPGRGTAAPALHDSMPRGRYLITARAEGYVLAARVFDIVPGENEVVLHFHATGVRLLLRDHTGDVRWRNDWRAWLEPLQGQEALDSRPHAGELDLEASAPGNYRLVVAPIAGYEPVPDETIRIPPDTLVEHVIELREKP